jgi:leucyl aminopeptidase
MNITLSTTDPLAANADLLALVCHEDTLTEDPLLNQADALLGGVLRQAIKDERFRAKVNQTLVLHTHKRLNPARLVIVGAGPRNSARPTDLRTASGRAARTAAAVGARTLAIASGDVAAFGTDPVRAAQACTEGCLLGVYRFDKYVTADPQDSSRIESVTLFTGVADGDADGIAAVERGRETALAICAARDLVNEPAGYLNPRALADTAAKMAADTGLTLTVLGPRECRERGMGLFLAVAQGSAEEPRFIHLSWKPPAARKRVVLIGKGVTFDSGGLSIKTNEGMMDMKTDMSGAAAVICAIAAAAREKLPVEVHAITAATENMPSGTAYKLGDVLRSMAGKTVEINNTDAEGRLTLADAITYGLELKPDAILDFATLTGACVVALGPHTAGVMSNDDSLSGEWLAAARAAGEDMWPLPLPTRLNEQLKSDIADMKNTGERWGGALTAGLFLKGFVGGTPWVHVDIAGPASSDKEFGHLPKGGTGFGVASILQYLRSIA